MSALSQLGTAELATLADALEAGRLAVPGSDFALLRFVPRGDAAAIAAELNRLGDLGMNAGAVAAVLRARVEERASVAQDGALELVWTGPESEGATSRDTAVLVREMFRSATRHVLVAGFAVYQGRVVFEVLAERLDAEPDLAVDMYLNVARSGRDDERSENEVLAAFSESFRSTQWPGRRLPRVYYDPRALEPAGGPRASLHAKVIVVHHRDVLVTSANFTEAAQHRNIEVGVRFERPAVARALIGHFESLVAAGGLRRLPGL